jgi:AraC-like DNA-binding protein
MELHTRGKVFASQYAIPIWYTDQPDQAFSSELGVGTRFRLVLVEQGAGLLNVNETCQPFIAPVLFCLNEQETVHLEQTQPVKVQALFFHPSVLNSEFTFESARDGAWHAMLDRHDITMLQPFVERDDKYGGQLRLGPMSAHRIRSLFQAAHDELTEQPNRFWICRSRSYLLELLFIAFRFLSAPDKHVPQLVEQQFPAAIEDVEPVIRYLHTHYQEKLTIDALARVFYTNRTTLTRRFRETTGVTVSAYLTRLRMRVAATMLQDTILPVSEVAHRVGFQDHSHFGRTFRRYMDCSPSEYRERYCWLLPLLQM